MKSLTKLPYSLPRVKFHGVHSCLVLSQSQTKPPSLLQPLLVSPARIVHTVTFDLLVIGSSIRFYSELTAHASHLRRRPQCLVAEHGAPIRAHLKTPVNLFLLIQVDTLTSLSSLKISWLWIKTTSGAEVFVGGFGDVEKAELRGIPFFGSNAAVALMKLRPSGDRAQRIRGVAVSVLVALHPLTAHVSCVVTGTRATCLA